MAGLERQAAAEARKRQATRSSTRQSLSRKLDIGAWTTPRSPRVTPDRPSPHSPEADVRPSPATLLHYEGLNGQAWTKVERSPVKELTPSQKMKEFEAMLSDYGRSRKTPPKTKGQSPTEDAGLRSQMSKLQGELAELRVAITQSAQLGRGDWNDSLTRVAETASSAVKKARGVRRETDEPSEAESAGTADTAEMDQDAAMAAKALSGRRRDENWCAPLEPKLYCSSSMSGS